MPALDDLLASRKALWLDYTDYAAALLANGAVPWLDAGAAVAWQRKAQGLLKSDVITLPVAAVCAAWIDTHPALREAMAAKRRAVVPLKTLLADEGLRTQLVELAAGLRACFPSLPLALAVPSPREWVAQAYRQAHGSEVEVGEDEADSAAVYLADFLRAFGEAGVDALLLQESAASEPEVAEALSCYQPVLNVAAHYRWDVGLGAPGGRYAGGAAGLGFVVAPRALPGTRAGCIVPEDFWTGAAPPDCPPHGFRYAVIPPGAQPEAVLQRLAVLH
ncbi:MAG TPA: hypothetical protein VLI06_19210 [Solimonas sp.]|nr:hypothetical protein [Solimonas sp.]